MVPLIPTLFIPMKMVNLLVLSLISISSLAPARTHLTLLAMLSVIWLTAMVTMSTEQFGSMLSTILLMAVDGMMILMSTATSFLS